MTVNFLRGDARSSRAEQLIEEALTEGARRSAAEGRPPETKFVERVPVVGREEPLFGRPALDRADAKFAAAIERCGRDFAGPLARRA